MTQNVDDLHDRVSGDMHPLAFEAFVAEGAEIGCAVALAYRRTEVLELTSQRGRKHLARDERPAERQVPRAELGRLLVEDAQRARRAHVAGGREPPQHLDLQLRIACTCGDHCAAKFAEGAVEHPAQRRAVVAHRAVDDHARFETGRAQRPRPPPVVGREPLRIKQRPRREERASDVGRGHAEEAAERRRGSL